MKLLLILILGFNIYATDLGIIVPLSGNYRIGHIRGFNVTYKDANEIYYSDGEIDVNGTLVKNVTASTAFELTTTNATDFYYLYISSAGTVTYSATEPAWSATLHGWYNSTTRCFGVVWTSGANTIAAFASSLYETSNMQYYNYGGVIAATLVNGAPNGAFQTLESTAYIPVNAVYTCIFCYESDAGSDAALYINSYENQSTFTGLALTGYASVSSTGNILVGASRDLAWNGADNDDDNTDIYTYGYIISR